MSSHRSKHGSANGSSQRHTGRKRRNLERPFLILHATSACLSLISSGLFVGIIPVWTSNFFFAKGVLRGDWPDAMVILPLLLAFTINTQYLLARIIPKRHSATKSHGYLKSRFTSPNAPSKLRLYLLITVEIVLLTFLILAGVTGLYRFWRPAVIASSVQMGSNGNATSMVSTLSFRRSITDANPAGLLPPSGGTSTSRPEQHSKAAIHSCSISNMFTRKCNPTLYLIGGLQIAAIVVGSLVWLLNLIILTLHLREYQYQKHKMQRSLRAKAKARLQVLEDDLDDAEKGSYSSKPKKIHHHKRERRHERSHSDSNSKSKSSTEDVSSVTRPHRAYSSPGSRDNSSNQDESVVKPKQYFHNPNISPSRPRPVARSNSASTVQSRTYCDTSYTQAVHEARRSMRPAETMRDWLTGKHS